VKRNNEIPEFSDTVAMERFFQENPDWSPVLGEDGRISGVKSPIIQGYGGWSAQWEMDAEADATQAK
jgi:hypothetical protein